MRVCQVVEIMVQMVWGVDSRLLAQHNHLLGCNRVLCLITSTSTAALLVFQRRAPCLSAEPQH